MQYFITSPSFFIIINPLGSQTSANNAIIKPSRLPIKIKLQSKLSDTVVTLWHWAEWKFKKVALLLCLKWPIIRQRAPVEPKRTHNWRNATHRSSKDSQVSFCRHKCMQCLQIVVGKKQHYITWAHCMSLHCIWINCSQVVFCLSETSQTMHYLALNWPSWSLHCLNNVKCISSQQWIEWA